MNNSLKKSTEKIYKSKINKLKKDLFNDINMKDEVVINDYKNVENWLKCKNYKVSTLKSWYIALYSLGKFNKLTNDNALEFYYKKMIKMRNKNNKYIKENKKSKKEDSEWVDYDELKTITENIKSELKLIDKNTETSKYYRVYTDYIIAALYTMIPPLRLDYHKMNVFYKPQFKYYARYIVIDKKNKTIKIHLNEYKNVNKLGKQVINIENKELINIIIDYMNFKKEYKFNTELLLYGINNEGNESIMSSNAFGQKVQRVFKKYLNKDINVNIIRHIYETWLVKQPHYQNMNLNQRETEHMKLLHSLPTGMQYMKIDDNKKVKEVNLEKAKEILLQYGYKLI